MLNISKFSQIIWIINLIHNLKYNSNYGGAKTWALALGLSPTFYQQYVRGEEIMGEPRN